MDNNSFDHRDREFSERIFGKPRPSNTSKALWWARKQGLNCEQDLMAATLRQLTHLTTVASIGLGAFVVIGLVLVFK